MKAPSFWFGKATVLGDIITPLGPIYGLAGKIRRAVTTPYRAKIPVICLGNIVAGGSGKTPTALAIAALLQQKGQRPVFVSRGHGGTERDPLRVDIDHHTAADVGDEPLLLVRAAPTYIGIHRGNAIRMAEHDPLRPTHIILDDGLQNPTFAASTNLLVVDAATGFGNGRLIPAGPLRETLKDALPRLQGIILIGENIDARQDIRYLETLDLPIIRASLRPQDVTIKAPRYLAFCGIGHPEKFYRACRAAGLDLVATRDFADHHPYTENELDQLLNESKNLNATLLTTAKDMSRIPPEYRNIIAVLDVVLSFHDSGKLIMDILH